MPEFIRLNWIMMSFLTKFEKKNPTSLTGFKPGSPGQTTEPKSRLPEVVSRRLFLYDTLYRIAVLFIDATHHVIRQPDLPTTNELCYGT